MVVKPYLLGVRFLQSKMWGDPYPEVPATTIHCRCTLSWQRVGDIFWGLANTLTTRVDARGTGTKNETLATQAHLQLLDNPLPFQSILHLYIDHF